MSTPDEPAQPALTRSLAAATRQQPRRQAEPLAAVSPVARVLVDIPLPHLDRPFDYHVPESMASAAVPGARVSVRFAGAVHDGFVVERATTTQHTGRLTRLRRVISPEPVLAPAIAELARAVADRYAGTVADVLRLAVPPRHAKTEAEQSGVAPPPPPAPSPGGWLEHQDGPALLTALTRGRSPRAVWNPGPAADWPDLLARLVAATLAGGRGAVVVLPDARDVARVDTALTSLVGPDHHVVLAAELGPSERYRRWLAVRRGAARAVVGTRSAMFAPVAELGLLALWDDGDDLHAEQRAPYPHAREVLLLRAHEQNTAAVVGGFARTAEAQQLVTSGWARAVSPPRDRVRATAPIVRVSGDDYEQVRDPAARTARIPSLAWRAAKDALQHGPVLVQVARTGYVAALACQQCRAVARCTECHGPVAMARGDQQPECRWCGKSGWVCPACGSHQLRVITPGVRRTAEELGKAFPGIPVRLSRGDAVVPAVESAAALVVATPGAEPVAHGGYAAALLLDGQAMLARPGLRAAEEALRRWLTACALVRPAPAGGQVVLVAEPSARPVQALVRWDPAGFAEHELADRQSLRFPPVARVAELTGEPEDVAALLQMAELPAGTDVLGPVPAGEDGTERVVIRVPRRLGQRLSGTLKAAQGVRSAKHAGGPVRVRIDPVDLG
ncbi:MAG TPA: primosomal protein N' [Jiangellaceae bacterium]